MLKTRVIFLGALHDDPSGKARLSHAVQNLTGARSIAPDFVAFEWARATYTALVPKRRELNERLRSRFKVLGETFRIHYSDTLAYEGDIYKEFGNSVRPIWMLDGFNNYDVEAMGNAEGFIRKKLANLEQWLLPKVSSTLGESDEALLQATTEVYLEESKRTSKFADAPQELEIAINSGRESYMFESIKNALKHIKTTDPTGVVIVGTGHLLSLPNTLLSLCGNAGFSTECLWPHEQ
jgi:hypothetical protein